MSHEHAQDNPSRSLPMNQPMGRVAREHVVRERAFREPHEVLGRERAVQHLAESDLLSRPPRTTDRSRVVGRLESGGLGRPSFVEIDAAGDGIPDALVLEYGRADAGQKRAARVWHRTRGMGSTPSYVLSGDSSSGGYVTA